MKARVLVTGGAGFIGSHLVDALLAGGAAVSVIDDFSSGKRNRLPEGAEIGEGDVRDQEWMVAQLREKKVQVLFHLAARVSVRQSLGSPLDDASVNVLGGVSVLEAAARSGVRRVILASSGGTIYGEGRSRASREDDPVEPVSPYGAAKAALETYAECYRRGRSLEVTCLRLANVYGPRQDPEAECGVIARFLRCLSEARPLEIYGDGLQVRDFVYVGDVVEAFLAAMGGPQGTFNVGTGVGASILDVVALLESSLGRSSVTSHRPAVQGEVLRNVLDVRRARDILGWEACTSLAEGIHLILKQSADRRPEEKIRGRRPGIREGV